MIEKSDRAAINLFTPLAVGGAPLGDYSDLAWKGGYQRTTLATGGEHEAMFRITENDLALEELERIFQDWLGYHMVESFAGKERHFFVHTLRLAVGTTILTLSMDDVFNQVNWYYQTDSAAAYALTAVAENADSQAIFGDKKAVVQASEYMPAAVATGKRDQYLTDHAFPHPYASTSGTGKGKPATLEIRFRGYVHEIAYDWYSSASTSTTARSTHVSDLISLASNITEGDIETELTVVTLESDNWITRLRRLDDTVKDTGRRYFVSDARIFTYESINTTDIFYTRRESDSIDHVYRGQQRVPPALVEPGRIIWTEDLFAGRAVDAILLRDPRARYLTRITYDINGVRQTGGPVPTQLKLKGDLALSTSRIKMDFTKDRKNGLTTRAG